MFANLCNSVLVQWDTKALKVPPWYFRWAVGLQTTPVASQAFCGPTIHASLIYYAFFGLHEGLRGTAFMVMPRPVRARTQFFDGRRMCGRRTRHRHELWPYDTTQFSYSTACPRLYHHKERPREGSIHLKAINKQQERNMFKLEIALPQEQAST
ncbi:hypothetical protein TSMEX_008254 [Taenia solium]|eukprot:TsM_000243300 transcript=TsM_000243300 gene=TsM_000243300